MTVIVVGGGVIGCAVAYELASRGVHVRLFESRGIGHGATRASAGILAPYIEGHDAALRRLAVCSLAMYDDFVHAIARDAGRAVEYERCGTLQAALDHRQRAELEQAARGLERLGVAHALLDAQQARAAAPALSPKVVAALRIDEHGFVAPWSMTRALADAAAARGTEFIPARVTSLQPSASGVEVAAGEHRQRAEAVIVAGGSWSSELAVPVRPIRGQLLRLRCQSRLAPNIVWGGRCYLVPRQDGTVLVGATAEDVGFDESATAEGVHGLLDAAIELAPELAHARFEDVRVGLRPRLADELPVIGRSSAMRGVFYATGHYRNGILLAPLTAALVADLVLDGRERPELDLVRPERLGL